MDAIEKIAMEMHRIACGQFHRTAQELWDEAHPIDRAEVRVDARHLIAAFPQLALEGREEWGVAGPWMGGPDIAADRAEAQRFAKSEFTSAVRRMAYYEPWSEVQS